MERIYGDEISFSKGKVLNVLGGWGTLNALFFNPQIFVLIIVR
jgi:hypothetical protein